MVLKYSLGVSDFKIGKKIIYMSAQSLIIFLISSSSA